MVNPVLRPSIPCMECTPEENHTPSDCPIFLCQQWFMSDNPARHKENVHVLQQNLANPYIHHIYLLNERHYSWQELGISPTMKLTQLFVGERLTYGRAWKTIRTLNTYGYWILANLDIFFDESIARLRQTTYHTEPICITGQRFEYIPQRDMDAYRQYIQPTSSNHSHLSTLDDVDDSSCNEMSEVDEQEQEREALKLKTWKIPTKIHAQTQHIPKDYPLYHPTKQAWVVPLSTYKPYACSNDAWILHSNTIQAIPELDHSSLQLGTSGCDNKIISYMYMCGIDIRNGTYHIPAYHYHFTNVRTYSTAILPNGYYMFINTYYSEEESKQVCTLLYEWAHKMNVYSLYPVRNPTHPRRDPVEFFITLSGSVHDHMSLMEHYQVYRNKQVPFHMPLLDSPSSFLSTLYLWFKFQKFTPDIRKLEQSTTKGRDTMEMVLYRWFIHVYVLNKRALGLLLSQEDCLRDFMYISSLYQALQPTQAKIHKITKQRITDERTSIQAKQRFSVVEAPIEQSGAIAYPIHGLSTSNHFVFYGLKNCGILDKIVNAKKTW